MGGGGARSTGAAGAHAGVRGGTGGTSEHILRHLAVMGDSHPGTLSQDRTPGTEA